MYDQVTLGLNVDPFILSALKEDITSEDVSTNSVMPHPQAGEVDLICKQIEIIDAQAIHLHDFVGIKMLQDIEHSVDAIEWIESRIIHRN